MDMAAFGGLPGGDKGATPSGSQAHHCTVAKSVFASGNQFFETEFS